MPSDVAVIVGSLRKASYSRMVATALMECAPASLRCRIVEIGDLPVYNEDMDPHPPASFTQLREDVQKADAILFVTPEYNRSIPGCLKNAVDVASRPQGKNLWDGKPAGVVSVTPYKLGAFGANHALRQTFVFLNMLVMQQPEAYIGGVANLFGDDGQLKSDETRKFLTKFMTSFAGWIAKIGSSGADFEAFILCRQKVAAAYVNGDATLLDKIATENDPATFYSPNGGHVSGAKAVRAEFDKGAKHFSPGSTSKLDILHSDSSGSLGYWTGIQDALVHTGEKKIPMKLRITELFRRERGDWKLIHRHADMLEEPQKKH